MIVKYLGAAYLCWIGIKSLIAAFRGFGSAAFLLVFLHSMINLVWFSLMVLLFSRLSAFARRGRFQRWLKGVTGVVFIGFGIKLAAYRPGV